jgi:hypothetical protein
MVQMFRARRAGVLQIGTLLYREYRRIKLPQFYPVHGESRCRVALVEACSQSRLAAESPRERVFISEAHQDPAREQVCALRSTYEVVYVRVVQKAMVGCKVSSTLLTLAPAKGPTSQKRLCTASTQNCKYHASSIFSTRSTEYALRCF